MHLLWVILVLVVLAIIAAPVVVIVLVVTLGRRSPGPTPATLYSPDGRWWWDGRAWQPVPPAPSTLQAP